MAHFFARSILTSALLLPGLVQGNDNPFVGRWNFDIPAANGTRACWLGVAEKNGALEVWFQPAGGNVYQVQDFKLKGSRLKLQLAKARKKRPALKWELTASGGQLTGIQKRGRVSTPIDGRARAGTATPHSERLDRSRTALQRPGRWTAGNRSAIPPRAAGW